MINKICAGEIPQETKVKNRKNCKRIAVADKIMSDNMNVQQQKWLLYLIVVVVAAVTHLIMV